MRTCRPGSGPVGSGIWIGEEELTTRCEDADEIQRAFFSNYYVAHGLKFLTVLLPNGLIGSVFGASLAQNDSGCLNKMGLCSYLERILPGDIFPNMMLHAVLGDGIFVASDTIVSTKIP